jgi:hypothetical protein
MPEVKIVRRWGSHQPGETVDLDETQARWLVGLKYAEDPNNEGTANPDGKANGEFGPDPLAGADPSRWRMTSAKSARVEQGLTGRIHGAPKRVGDVTHVADENLGREHRENRNDVPRASGKRTSEELKALQEEIEEQDKRKVRDERPDNAKVPAGKTEKTSLVGEDNSDGKGEGRKLTQK